MRFPVTGVIAVDKPVGVSSRRVVDRVATALSTRAFGHAGTLDPIASGVVVVCVGNATKLIDFLHILPKRYVGRFLLGRSSPSDDTELPVELEADPRQPFHQEVADALQAFRGEIMQRPCDYSAVHVNGKRAYALARKGHTVELPPKPVTIHRLTLLAYDWPRLELDVECSTGTYIRGLGRDLAAALGTTAVMDGLVRTSVGPFDQSDAVPLGALMGDDAEATAMAAVAPARSAVAHIPSIILPEHLITHVASGGILQRSVVPDAQADAAAVAAIDQAGTLIGILRPHRDGWRTRPNFVGHS